MLAQVFFCWLVCQLRTNGPGELGASLQRRSGVEGIVEKLATRLLLALWRISASVFHQFATSPIYALTSHFFPYNVFYAPVLRPLPHSPLGGPDPEDIKCRLRNSQSSSGKRISGRMDGVFWGAVIVLYSNFTDEMERLG